MNFLSTRNYLKQEKKLIVRELFNSDQLNHDAHIDDAIVLRTDQLEQIAQRILDHLMAEPQPDQDEEINAWSVDE